MARRLHIPLLQTGQIDLAGDPARYLRDVLRLSVGDELEAFNDGGGCAMATIIATAPGAVSLRIGAITQAAPAACEFTIASAVPKGPRADWLIEKISELGAAAFVPLITARGVAQPKGEKPQRWARLAAEAARQSGRTSVLRIEPLTRVADLLAAHSRGAGPEQAAWYLSTDASAMPIFKLTASAPPRTLLMLTGPEGGWTAAEIEQFRAAHLTAVKLTHTILRIETAAIAAAAAAALWIAAGDHR